jgi:hypothetical protein
MTRANSFMARSDCHTLADEVLLLQYRRLVRRTGLTRGIRLHEANYYTAMKSQHVAIRKQRQLPELVWFS